VTTAINQVHQVPGEGSGSQYVLKERKVGLRDNKGRRKERINEYTDTTTLREKERGEKILPT